MTDRFVRQLDGCSYCPGGRNCTCAVHAMWLYRASQGRIALSSCQVRRKTGDTIGGTNLRQMETISTSYHLTGALWMPGGFASLRSKILTGRFGAHCQVGYSQIAGTEFDCFDGDFRGAHDIYIKGGTENYATIGDPGADGRRASIPDGWQHMPWDLLERAAGALPLSPTGPTLAQSEGSGRVYAYLTPPDPIEPAQQFSVQIVAQTNLYSAPNGHKVGGVTKATYICTRSKVNGLWWYHIDPHAKTVNRGLYFKPNGSTIARGITA